MTDGEAFEVEVNGEAREVPDGATVADLLDLLEVDRSAVAVERNRRVVPRAEHGSESLEPGDRIEVVTFVGGG